jgi:hypothetical protein
MIPANKIHVLLHSFSQGCFHFETLDQTIATGIESYAKNQCQQDYIVLAVGNSREELNTVRDRLISAFGRYTPTRAPHDPQPTNTVVLLTEDAVD